METDKEPVDREGITYCGQVSREQIYKRYLQVHFTYPELCILSILDCELKRPDNEAPLYMYVCCECSSYTS